MGAKDLRNSGMGSEKSFGLATERLPVDSQKAISSSGEPDKARTS